MARGGGVTAQQMTVGRTEPFPTMVPSPSANGTGSSSYRAVLYRFLLGSPFLFYPSEGVEIGDVLWTALASSWEFTQGGR